MREIRLSGSEGGGTGNSTGPPYPYHRQERLAGPAHIANKAAHVLDPVPIREGEQGLHRLLGQGEVRRPLASLCIVHRRARLPPAAACFTSPAPSANMAAMPLTASCL